MPAVALADTSIFIAQESGRPVGELPERVLVSAVTIGELQLGVLAADDPDVRARRADTLALARSADPLPCTDSTFVAWARLVNACRAAGSSRFVKLTDSLIAATAIDRGLPVVTQDADFDAMAAAMPELIVVRV